MTLQEGQFGQLPLEGITEFTVSLILSHRDGWTGTSEGPGSLSFIWFTQTCLWVSPAFLFWSVRTAGSLF